MQIELQNIYAKQNPTSPLKHPGFELRHWSVTSGQWPLQTFTIVYRSTNWAIQPAGGQFRQFVVHSARALLLCSTYSSRVHSLLGEFCCCHTRTKDAETRVFNALKTWHFTFFLAFCGETVFHTAKDAETRVFKVPWLPCFGFPGYK
jgi:hypothetical protein